MALGTCQCSICASAFEPQFAYQMEERSETGADGHTRVAFVYFCSQLCLEASHHQSDGGTVRCDMCGVAFSVELASQVLFVSRRRLYACGAECRASLKTELTTLRLADAASSAQAIDAGWELNAVNGSEAPESGETPASSAPTNLPPVLDPQRSTPLELVPRVVSDTLPPADAPRSARVIAVFNHKGGTGKTTTAVTLAANLALSGRRVLLVDTDGQGNVGVSLALNSERSLYHVLVMGLALEEAVLPARENFDVLLSNETLAAAELYLAGRKGRDRILAQRLAAARDLYDYVIVDCSPSLSLLNQNALVFADDVLCPVACDYLSLVGVRQVLRTVKHVNKLLGHPVRFWAVLPTMFDARARICREALDTLRDHFGERCLEPVRTAIKVKEAPSLGRTLPEHAQGSSAAEDYQRVVERLLSEERAQTQLSQQGRGAA